MVPKISFGAPVVAACRAAFPNTVFDVKLGCIEPEARVNDFVKAGADIISVHPEATLQLGAVINKIADFGVAPGVILNPGTSVTSVEHVLDQMQRCGCHVGELAGVFLQELVFLYFSSQMYILSRSIPDMAGPVI
jgi:pentose-5-phosphate-3-epimerase